ncbi:glycoside hydrolase family 15 protein [Actinacidiphila alni]|uniref:glycoside hydrolase family 15 protein n=1 Tax=Actinacidiphila alni TaxID=380248 RepID=UPI003F4D4F2B
MPRWAARGAPTGADLRPVPEPLRDYALIADGERGALVGPRGEIVWMCAPRWDSDAVFADLIGGAGHYRVGPRGRFVRGGYYEEGSLVWRSRWVTEQGVVTCREALAFPGDPHRAVLLRRVVADQGPAELTVVLEPAAGFGRDTPRGLRRDRHGVWTARCGDLRLRWTGAARARPLERGRRLVMELSLRPGDHHDLVLELSDAELPGQVDADQAWRATETAWRRQVPALDATLAPRDARRAYAVMRGLTGSAGGMVAAATTSLPERAEEGRNYDYRYVWLRDQCFAGQAVAAAGQLPLLDDAVRFTTARLLADGPDVKPAYAVDGTPIPDQRRLDLPGYPGGFDLVGNRVSHQFQLDAFGELLLLLAAAARAGTLDADGVRAAEVAADAIRDRWTEHDAGIWELGPRAWTHSRLICVAGLRAIAAAGAGSGSRARDWPALADAILADTDRHALHPSGRWQRSPDDDAVDAALLMPALRGAVPADDPRTVRTLDAFLRDLADDHMAYRFRHDDRPLAEAEGAFVMCGFVVALAEHQQGREPAALRWFERNRAASGPAGLFSEEYDIDQGQSRGNLPQAFVHALLLEAAARLGGGRHAAGS